MPRRQTKTKLKTSRDKLGVSEKAGSEKRITARKHVLTVKVKSQPKPTTKRLSQVPPDEQIEEYLEAQHLAQEKIVLSGQNNYEAVDKKKKLIMWTGVTVGMLAILVFWVFNLKEIFKQTAPSGDNQIMTDWQKTAEQIGEQIDKMRSDWETIQSLSEATTTSSSTINNAITPVSNSSTSSVPSAELSQEIEELKAKIEAATTTATTTAIY